MSAGGLVWVRLRNGRWWPGQVLGPEELPDSLPSPKSGTPIKLLGKEDESVDWYDVDKPARVKDFRCWEYDKCIEKAKAAAEANSSKKIVKYATREDAILHALEIEGAGLEIDHPDICSEIKNEEVQHTVEDSPLLFDEICVEDDSSSFGNDSDIAQEVLQCDAPFEDPNVGGTYGQEYPRPTSNDSEDDDEGDQRKKGLEDLGMGIVSSLKRKRSQVVHEFLIRKNRQRTVKRILHSTQVVNIPVILEELAHPTMSLPLGALCSVLSGSGSDVIERTFSLGENDASSDGLYNVPIITEEDYFDGDFPLYYASAKAHTGDGTKSRRSRQVKTVMLKAEDVNESGSTSSAGAEINNIWPRVNNGTSKWQLKKKRSRHTIKSSKHSSMKFMDVDDINVAGEERLVDCKPFEGCPSDNTTGVTSRAVFDIQVDGFREWSKNTSHQDPCIDQTTTELQTHQRLLPYRQSRLSVNPKYQDFSLGHHTAESSLFAVNVEVRVDHRPHHVPYVSLVSKLIGRPVTGHPLALEVLEDGICDDYIGNSACYSSSWELVEDFGDDTSALGDMELGLGASSNSVRRVPVKPTRISASKSTKFRKLSSLSRVHKKSEEKKLIVDKLRGPSVACVPLTIVFSRINEGLSSSNRPAYRP